MFCHGESRYPVWCVHMGKISSSVTEISVAKTEIYSVGNPGQLTFSYEHIEFFLKKRVTRRDLGNRASPVDRAHMKRP